MNGDLSNTLPGASNINFSDFIGNHFFLIILLLIFIILYCYYEYQYVKVASLHVSVKVAVNLFNKKQIQIMDVRDKNEFKKSHISGAKNLSLQDLSKGLKKPIYKQDSNFLLVGDKKNSSDKAALILKSQGFKNVKILSGGMKPWVKEQMPVEKGLGATLKNTQKGSFSSKKKKNKK